MSTSATADQHPPQPKIDPLSDEMLGTNPDNLYARRIASGLVIRSDEARRWYREQFGEDLGEFRLADLNLPGIMNEFLQEEKNKDLKLVHERIHFSPAPRMREFDVLVDTQFQDGWFWYPITNNGEVVDPDVKAIRGQYEDRIEKLLKDEMGITTSGFKSYYEE
ncbi:hypothetical protein CYLTODRAFT_492134 [Cylindrobasidium torrendii FP15055 ss-10]|uniref:Uncharacterized protein n=1 Tax=Cylindrobasidium torrendii FP15055 ss-10 TaxID=1314674 RepID=A0A0D7B7W5_9AGAR|nr:hypothetical protein CYLTODRAFT_492134 [Cylindrobasidium torrendii FP15055 ss-10]